MKVLKRHPRSSLLSNASQMPLRCLPNQSEDLLVLDGLIGRRLIGSAYVYCDNFLKWFLIKNFLMILKVSTSKPHSINRCRLLAIQTGVQSMDIQDEASYDGSTLLDEVPC